MFRNGVLDFVTGFQFLTRIPVVTQSEWSMESFGRSVKFFPIIGGIIGLILCTVVYVIQYFWGLSVPLHAINIGIIVLEIFLTGGLHCDGLMDTVDGVFSGRPREKMLEIMKDSRVGAFGAMAFTLLWPMGRINLWRDYGSVARSIISNLCKGWRCLCPRGRKFL